MKRAVLSALGALILTVSMPLGIAFAAPSDSVSVNVICSSPSIVNISASDFGNLDIALTNTASNSVSVDVNVGCWAGGWHVDATVSPFDGPGPLFIPASWLSLENTGVSSPFVDAPAIVDFDPIGGPPPGDAESDGEIFGTAVLLDFSPFFVVDVPAPGISSATYNGHLTLQGPVVPATYTATITVTLTKEGLIQAP